ncbi:hypothetical protein PSA7680_00288 [Pseudoruegeria aquimaris]|uniref:Lipoprotein n=1 Tax=Pseudoruegeria aquimaris TaxID=393663 RepID=A0A1Y5RC73_9RHOB|nr:hypothetical protein [Pseudoruegeria aquimaris]SLN14082.1 hypothetical protein PSA7680_00288 [Pseudoruegeria aquimaris]
MKTAKFLIPGLVAALAGCNVQTSSPSAGGAASGYKPASEQVRELAAPNQNLDAVRVDPEDGCYWFLYAGPVETTWLPLKTTAGNPICTGAAATS